ncbi:hypothetical protein [Botrimarina sp.]|uniref:hypothetical protein n=1 Tax=Botrimarina sp. TaxID=2795802 RepID=UPI0032F0516C
MLRSQLLPIEPRFAPQRFALLLAGLAATSMQALGADTEASYLEKIQSHFDRVLEVGVDKYGDDTNDLWIASIDLRKGGQNESVDSKSRRAYRRIHAPRGSNLYWDIPLLVTAHRVSELSGDRKYSEGADRCVSAFLERCVSDKNGFFLWGNHLFYDVFRDEIERIGHFSHEARPIPVAWEAITRVSPEAAAACVRSMAELHVVDHESGFFDRHAPTNKKEIDPDEEFVAKCYPFIETGGVLVESIAWLAAQRPDDRQQLIDTALKVARFSAADHGEETGVVRNQGHRKRWDYYHGTTEIGLWAGDLLRAAELTGVDEFVAIAEPGLLAYLEHGWDADAGKYYGALRVEDAKPRHPEEEQEYPYQPDLYADVWEPLFPIHDYPMAMAEACLSFYERTGKEAYREAAQRWIEHIENSLPAKHLSERHGGHWVDGAYAADYGAVIHYLSRAAKVLDDDRARELAHQIAREAVGTLYIEDLGAFRSHPGEDVADTIDGLGTLFLALLELETGEDGDLMGYHF